MASQFMIIIAGAVIYAIPVIYLFVQWRAIRDWRFAAALPAVFAAFLFGVTVLGFWQKSNLWPLPLIFGLPVCLVLIAVLAVLRRVFSGARPPR